MEDAIISFASRRVATTNRHIPCDGRTRGIHRRANRLVHRIRKLARGYHNFRKSYRSLLV